MGIPQKIINKQRRIGLTGGIASGKSTITEYIKTYKKIPILDADNFSKELTKPNTFGYKKITEYFGNQIINKNSEEKTINRKFLRSIIFKDEKSREWIQNLLHPLIKEKMIYESDKYKNNRVILLVIPLLFEAKYEDICTEIWLVKCKQEEQIKRLVKRDKISEEEAYSIIKLQFNFKTKTKFSDVILDNSDTKHKWKNQIKELI